MNKYVRAMYCVPFGMLKMIWTKIFNFNSFKGPILCMISPLTEITLDNTGKLTIGRKFKMRDGAKIRVRKNGVCEIGNNTSINSNNIITCHNKITIGNGVQLSPNVQIYDHDHDFRAKFGLKSNEYVTGGVEIGNNVWIGASSIILRGTKIEDNSVIAAGSVVKGTVPEGSILIQKRNTDITVVNYNED